MRNSNRDKDLGNDRCFLVRALARTPLSSSITDHAGPGRSASGRARRFVVLFRENRGSHAKPPSRKEQKTQNRESHRRRHFGDEISGVCRSGTLCIETIPRGVASGEPNRSEDSLFVQNVVGARVLGQGVRALDATVIGNCRANPTAKLAFMPGSIHRKSDLRDVGKLPSEPKCHSTRG